MSDSLPYNEDGFVYFELASARLAVFECAEDAAIYEIPGGKHGVYRLPVDAILKPTGREREEAQDQIVSVDRAQIFFVDSGVLQSFASEFDDSQGSWPNFEYFDAIRRKIGSSFGYLAVGSEPAEFFTGDGTYIIDVSQIEFVPDPLNRHQGVPERSELELMALVAKSMGTFVCNVCYNNEWMCGRDDPEGSAKEAKELGWAVTKEESDFGSFKVYCPRCAESDTRTQ